MSSAVKAAELNPDIAATSASASSQSASQRDKEKYSNLSDDESEQITKVKTKHIHRTKDASDDSNSSSSASSASSNSDATFFDDPVARIKAVPRGTWLRLVLLLLSLGVLFMAWHPTAYYRTQLYFGQCVEIPSRGGMVHKICPPQSIPHPLS